MAGAVAPAILAVFNIVLRGLEEWTQNERADPLQNLIESAIGFY
jgi:hypothetical protein